MFNAPCILGYDKLGVDFTFMLLIMQEILFSAGAAICYFATGIACTVYASAWGGPPDACMP